jgi:hypothetical protein
MKIRQGFVSNSSSSSFVLWGVSSYDVDMDRDAIENFTYGEKKIAGLQVSSGIESDGFFVGGSPTSMRDDETLLQFKQRIVDMLAKADICVTASDIQFHHEAGYNG